MTLTAQFIAGLPGGYEWLIILFIILILFGRRLPGVARSLGQGISSFKKGLNEPEEDESPKKAPPPSAPQAAEESSSSES